MLSKFDCKSAQKWLIFLTKASYAGSLLSSSLFAFPTTYLDLMGGYRHDQFQFNMASQTASAEYHFDNVNSGTLGLRGRYMFSDCWYARAFAS